MKKNILFLLFVLLLVSCSSTTKVELRKYNLADTSTTIEEYKFSNFVSAFRFLRPEIADSFATTESQKKAAEGLKCVTLNKLENAADIFCEALKEKDSMEALWGFFPNAYHSCISYNWDKLQKCIEIREGNGKEVKGHSSPSFYKDKPNFNIDFKKDSVVIPIKFSRGLPLVKIKINEKYYYFLIDTGVNKTLIGKNIVTSNDILYDNEERTVTAIDGKVTVYSGFLPELDLGDIKISNFPVDVVNRNDAFKVTELFFITTFRCDGVIGWDLLQRFDFTIDYKNKQLTLRKPVEKNIQQKNLFWYEIPIVKFYSENNYPIIFFFDTGSNLTSFATETLSRVGLADTNNLKKRTVTFYGVGGNKVKQNKYNYPNFQCYTLSDNEMTLLSVDKAVLQDMEKISTSAIYVDGVLGSDLFKGKAIRVDMKNGLFEIYE